MYSKDILSKQALGVLCPFLGAYYVKTLQSLLYCRCLYRARTVCLCEDSGFLRA